MKKIALCPFAVAALYAVPSLQAAPVTEVSAVVDIGRGSPNGTGFVSLSLVNAEGLELVCPLEGRTGSPHLHGDARFGVGVPIGNWEPTNIRYFRVTHHNAPAADWEASHVLITAVTAAGPVILFDQAVNERVYRLRRSFGSDLRDWLFDDSHRQLASASRSHVDLVFQGRMANGTFGVVELELSDGRILHHRVAPYSRGTWQRLRFDLPDGSGTGGVHRCRFYYHGGGSNEWHIASLDIKHVSEDGGERSLTWSNGITLRGVEVFESAVYGTKIMPAFPASRFLIQLRTGGDDLRGRVDPRSELRVTLYLRDGRQVLLHTPLIEKLNDYSSHTVEAQTEDGSGVWINEIESYEVHAVHLGGGSTWPRHREDPQFNPGRLYSVDPFRQDDRWLLQGTSISAAPLGSTLQVSLPPPAASIGEVIPGHSNDVRLLPTPAETRLGYDPHPAWFRLETHPGLARRIQVNPNIRPSGPLSISQRVYWVTDRDEAPGERDPLRDVLFPFETASEAIVAGEGKAATAYALDLLGDRKADLQPAPRKFGQFRSVAARHMEFRLMPDRERDSDGDGSPDAEAYAFGLAPGERPEIRLDQIGAETTIVYRRADRLSDIGFRVSGSGDGQNWRNLSIISETNLGRAYGPAGTEWVMLKVSVPEEWGRTALFRIATYPILEVFTTETLELRPQLIDNPSFVPRFEFFR